jgi:hypothetical protein
VNHILEEPVAKPDNSGMVEVGIGCKEHPASVKFIIHNLLFCAHHCAVNKNFTTSINKNDGEGRMIRTSPMSKKTASRTQNRALLVIC